MRSLLCSQIKDGGKTQRDLVECSDLAALVQNQEQTAEDISCKMDFFHSVIHPTHRTTLLPHKEMSTCSFAVQRCAAQRWWFSVTNMSQTQYRQYPSRDIHLPGEPINWYLEICRLITNVYARMIAAHSNLEGWLLQLKPYITGGRLQAVFHFEHGHRGAHLDRVTL
jgi:hypothetical protein